MRRWLPIIVLVASSLPALGQTVATPVFTPPTGTQFANGQIVTITTSTGGAKLCYTVDGSTPTAVTAGTCSHGTTLTNGGTVTVNVTETINVLGTLVGDTNSAVAAASFTIGGGITSNIDDIPPTASGSPAIGWATPPFLDPACGGFPATSYPHTIQNASPSVDGFSSLFTINGPPQTCVGWFYNAGPQDTATLLTNDFRYQSGSTNATGNANEFDIYQYIKAASNPTCLAHNTDFYFGTQCVTATGNLQIWDQGGTGWHYTSPTISCAAGFATGSWHHITMNDHWTCGDTSGTGGYPKQCYDTFTLDGVAHTINTCYSASALPNTYSENTGVNFELDIGAAGTSLSANLDEASLTFASPAPPNLLTVTMTGSGVVTSNPSGISCPGTCSATFIAGTVVTLSESPSVGYLFTSWGGSCSGAGSCLVTMSVPRTVTATFTQQTASTPACVPAGGTFASPTTTTCTSTGPVQCYSFATPPATNGGTGCTTGVLVTGPIPINATVTLQIVGGGGGEKDSAVATYPFTVTTAGNIGNGNTINAVQAPYPSGTNSAIYASVVAQHNPLLSGQTLIFGLNQIDIESGTDSGPCVPNISFTQVDAAILFYTTNFLLAPVTEGGTNTFTPNCVWSQAWADAVALTYGPAGTRYLPGDYVFQCSKYWVASNNTYSSPSLDNTNAIAGGANFCVAGPIIDGGITWTQSYVSSGAHAPTQDGFCGNNYKCGSGGTDCYTANGSTAIVININALGPCTLTNLHQSQALAQELPIRAWKFAVIAATIAHLNGKAGYIRVGDQGGELSPLGIGSGLWPNYCAGMTGNTPTGCTSQQERAQYLSWVNILDAFIMAQHPTMTVASDMNIAGQTPDATYADQEAQLAYNYCMTGIGTAGFQVNDVENLLQAADAPTPCTFPLASSTTCGAGDWPYNFSRFPKNACGQRMFHILQTLTGTTNNICTAGVSPGITGPLGPLPVGSTYCPNGFQGLLPFLVNLCKTGVDGGLVKICDSIFEEYVNGPANNPNSGTGSQAWPAGDVLLALYPQYCTNAANQQCAATNITTSTVNSYQSVMAAYLGLTYNLGIQPPTGVSFILGAFMGPPNYYGSRTDTAIAPPGGVIAVPPQLGPNTCVAGNLLACGNVLGANTTAVDPDFNTPLARMTDALSVPNGNTVQTADAGGANIWNCTGTLACGGTGPSHIILKATGGNRYLFQFNPATMQTSPTGALIGNFGTSWSHAHASPLPYRAYYMNGTVLTAMDVTPGTQTFTTTALFDYGGPGCLGNPINGQSPYNLVWTGVLQQSFDDNVFGIGFGNQPGGQDHGYHFATYNLTTGICTVYNTLTGQVVQNGVSLGSVSFAERFYLHEAHSEPNPNYAILIPATSGCVSGTCAVGPYLFSPGSLTFTYCGPSAMCSGETASGYLQLEQGNGTGNINVHKYTSWGVTNPLITAAGIIPAGIANCPGSTYHPSWNNNDGTDTLPVFASFGGTCTMFNAAWQKEFVGFFQNGQKVVRFLHNFNSGINSQFDTQAALCQVSQDGRFVACSTDLMGTLGPEHSTTLGQSCQQTPTPTCRGDVIVGRLN